jgi:hypothetical protein
MRTLLGSLFALIAVAGCGPESERIGTYDVEWRLYGGTSEFGDIKSIECVDNECFPSTGGELMQYQCADWGVATIGFTAKDMEGFRYDFTFPCEDHRGFSSPLPNGRYLLSCQALDRTGTLVPSVTFQASLIDDGKHDLVFAGGNVAVPCYFLK